MIGLFDRDVFLKLACCDLWDEAIEALGITTAYRLNATSNPKSNARALSRMLQGQDHTAALARAQGIVARVECIPDVLADGVLTDPVFRSFGRIEHIDGGEQFLATLLRLGHGDLLLTGDKRFIGALRTNAPRDWASMKGSLVSFEACIARIEKRFGFETIKDRIQGARRCDSSLRMAIGAKIDKETFLEGLASFDPMAEA